MEINFNIQQTIKKALDRMGFKQLTEIQQRAIPLILEGKDVIGKSQTGSGKTIAFGVPAVNTVDYQLNKKYTQVLVLCPTRELAIQACGEIRKVSKYTKEVKTLALYGGQPLAKQIPMIRQGCQIVVGTPGRIMDLIKRKALKLSALKMVVLDEADEMLNMGFRDDIEKILSAVPEQRQTILFSATMPKEIMDIVHKYQTNPELIEVKNSQMTVDTIKQYAIECPKGKKIQLLIKLIEMYDINVAIVFCNTKKMVDELKQVMHKNLITAEGLHGDMRQRDRDKVMAAFRKGKVKLLIATDVAARGIDVSNVEYVINYDIPTQTEYYVHRIGRTGRAGKNGVSFTLIQGESQKNLMKQIIKHTKSSVEKLEVEGFVVKKDARQHKPATRTAKSKKRDAKKQKSKNVNCEQSDKMCNIKLSVGRKNNIYVKHIVGAIAGETGIKGSCIGKIKIEENTTIVQIPKKYKKNVVDILNGVKIKGVQIAATLK